MILPKGGAVNCFKGFGLVLEALNDVVLFLEQHIELFEFLVDGKQVGSEHRHLIDLLLEVGLDVLAGVG